MNYKKIIKQLSIPYEALAETGPTRMPEMWRKWRCLRDAIHALEEIVEVEVEVEEQNYLGVPPLERENTILREALEKFRGQFDNFGCTGTAEITLESLEPESSANAKSSQPE